MKKLPSARVLRRLIDYDPATGEMRWKERPVWMFAAGNRGRAITARNWNLRYAGKPAFTAKNEKGYHVGRVFDRSHKAHRVAWVIEYGQCANEIDHINGDRSDNRIANLRNVSHAQNMRNHALRSNNKTGVMGVSQHSTGRGWAVVIGTNYVGYFPTKEDAIAARKAAERKYGFHANHGRAA